MDPGDEREHNLMVAIFSVAAGMVGVCMTGIGLLHVSNRSTIADECLAIDATLFLGCCLSAFLSFRARNEKLKHKLHKAADKLFFGGLLLMVVICAMITSTFL